MPWAAIIPAVASVAGGLLSANAAGDAADASAAGAARAAELQRYMYDQTRADNAPGREAQRYALDALLSMTGLPGLTGATGGQGAGTGGGANAGTLGGARSLPFTLSGLGRRSGYSTVSLPSNTASQLRDINANASWDHNAAWDMDTPRANRLPPVNRLLGGPIKAGRQYNLSEIGHPEGIYSNDGTLRDISTQPQTMTAQEDGYVAPLGPSPTGFDLLDPFGTSGNLPFTGGNPLGDSGGGGGAAPASAPWSVQASAGGIPANYQQYGIPIPGSTTMENPGGQPGRYNFMADPGYQFRMDEGQRAIERSASARGGVLSGGILRELSRYGQGLGSAEYGNVFNRLSGIAGIGQNAQNTTAQAGMNSANQQGGYLQSIGDAQGAGALGRASAYGDTLSQLGRIYGQYNQGRTP